jgi:hypothetical protein
MWLLVRGSRRARFIAWMIVSLWGVVYLFTFLQYDGVVNELCPGLLTRPSGVMSSFEGNLPTWQRTSPVPELLADPTFAAALILGVAPILVGGPALVYVMVTGQRSRYQCRQCGYDLTGNASGRCPECGSRFGVRDGGAANGDLAETEARDTS